MQNTNAVAATVEALLTSQKIPDLNSGQMSALLHYLFNTASSAVRIRVAEVAFRYDRGHRNALDLFLACVLPLAERAARRRAQRFLQPSEWRIEAMYDGAVNLAIEMFQRGGIPCNAKDGFQRYLLRTLVYGTLRYFAREENLSVHPVTDIRRVRPFDGCRQGSTGRRQTVNTVEEQMITRQLLEQVTNCPQATDGVRATLQCIATLGPDLVLKQHAFTASGDPDNWNRERGRRPILDPNAIAKAMGINRRAVHNYLLRARVILRQTFNADGRLFERR